MKMNYYSLYTFINLFCFYRLCWKLQPDHSKGCGMDHGNGSQSQPDVFPELLHQLHELLELQRKYQPNLTLPVEVNVDDIYSILSWYRYVCVPLSSFLGLWKRSNHRNSKWVCSHSALPQGLVRAAVRRSVRLHQHHGPIPHENES